MKTWPQDTDLTSSTHKPQNPLQEWADLHQNGGLERKRVVGEEAEATRMTLQPPKDRAVKLCLNILH